MLSFTLFKMFALLTAGVTAHPRAADSHDGMEATDQAVPGPTHPRGSGIAARRDPKDQPWRILKVEKDGADLLVAAGVGPMYRTAFLANQGSPRPVEWTSDTSRHSLRFRFEAAADSGLRMLAARTSIRVYPQIGELRWFNRVRPGGQLHLWYQWVPGRVGREIHYQVYDKQRGPIYMEAEEEEDVEE